MQAARPSPDHIHNGHATVKLLRASRESKRERESTQPSLLETRLPPPPAPLGDVFLPDVCLFEHFAFAYIIIVVIKKNNKMYSGAKESRRGRRDENLESAFNPPRMSKRDGWRI